MGHAKDRWDFLRDTQRTEGQSGEEATLGEVAGSQCRSSVPGGLGCVTLLAVDVCKPRSSEPVTSGVLLAASSRGHDGHQLSPQPLASWQPPHPESCHWDHRLSCRPGKSRDLKSPVSGARSEMKNSQEWILLRILHCEYFHGRLALHYESGGHVFHPLSHAGKLRDGRNGAVHVSLSQVLMRLPVWLLQGVSTWGGRGMDQPTGLGVSVPV